MSSFCSRARKIDLVSPFSGFMNASGGAFIVSAAVGIQFGESLWVFNAPILGSFPESGSELMSIWKERSTGALTNNRTMEGMAVPT